MCDTCYKKYKRRNNPETMRKFLESRRRWHKLNPEKSREIKRRYITRHPERIKAKNLAWRARTPEKQAFYKRTQRVKKKFGVSVAELEAFRTSQGGHCAICSVTENVFVDHNHKNGTLRGLLCSHCNSMIGFARENIEVLAKAIKYIREHNGY